MSDLGPLHSTAEGPCRFCGQATPYGDHLGPVHARCRAQAAGTPATPVPTGSAFQDVLESTPRRSAVDELADLLAVGPVPAVDVLAAMAQLGHGEHAARSAKRQLGVVTVKGGMSQGWSWRLPGEACGTCGRPWPKAGEDADAPPLDPPSAASFGTPSPENPPTPGVIPAPSPDVATPTDDDVTVCTSCGMPSYLPAGRTCIRAGCKGVSL